MEIKELNEEKVLHLLPDRNPHSHKGDYGRILLLCGSKGYTGAAALAAMGALRSGAGVVYLGVPESIYAIEAVKLNEPVVFSLPDQNGMYHYNCSEQICRALEGKDAILIGPGIGQSDGSRVAVETVLEQYSGPVVLDADGINVICKRKDILRRRNNITILTPHLGEFKRIFGNPITNAMEAARDFALDTGTILLLKGHETLITDGITCYVNPTGNPGMAVGGSGDVLAGMIVSLLGQGIAPLEAAACAAWLHGRAGDICSETIGQYGMIPSDMLQILPRLMK